ncbi:MAG TPA: alcohol dehydrogenase catalytic domain-containing protein [Acidimicrobiia bacterium]|nr:alcohol dehydrogenase catalytic domain-containing protein [Acidimicrobiia bacterium]
MAIPESMRAAVYVGDGAIEVQDIAVPELGSGDALVEVSHCGICGTDLHLVLEQYARPGSVLGHEWSGTVAATGPDVHDWEPGTPVVLNPTGGCGTCRACRAGRPAVCLQRDAPDLLDFSHGAFTRYKLVRAAQLLRIPEELTLRQAALSEPTAIAIHTVNLSGVGAGDRVLVTGGGPVGLLTTAVLRARGVDDITVSEPAPARRERAQAVGATRVVDPSELPRAPMGRAVDDPFTVAFECSGNARAAESALDQLDYAGTLVFVGTGHEFPRVNHNRMIVMEQTIIGAYNYDADGFVTALALLASGALPLDLLIEPVDIGLRELQPTLHRLAAGELPGKVMVVPQ